ncbi:MAG: fasciclin domain-containing protein [Caldilineaceae bacterium]
MKKVLRPIALSLTLTLLFTACTLNLPNQNPTPTPTRTPSAPAATTPVTNTTGVTGTAGTTATTGVTSAAAATGASVLVPTPVVTGTAVAPTTPVVTSTTSATGTNNLTTTGGATPTATGILTATSVITAPPGTANVFRTISTIKGLETLNSAFITTNLVNELDVTTRTLTIFAPTNQAFLALPANQRQAILGNPTLLRNILLYHVVVDRVTEANLVQFGRALTALGETVTVTRTANGQVRVNNATIIQPDLPASNGLIQVIDRLLIPTSLLTATNTVTGTVASTTTGGATTGAALTTTQTVTIPRVITTNVTNLTIAQVISRTPELRTLAVALQAAGMVNSLSGVGPVTIFAPTNQAFATLPSGTLQNLLNTPTALVNVLRYHIVADRVGSADLARLGVVLSTQGQSITVTVGANGSERVGNATIVQRDIVAANGIIHVINGVLTPPTQ